MIRITIGAIGRMITGGMIRRIRGGIIMMEVMIVGGERMKDGIILMMIRGGTIGPIRKRKIRITKIGGMMIVGGMRMIMIGATRMTMIGVIKTMIGVTKITIGAMRMTYQLPPNPIQNPTHPQPHQAVEPSPPIQPTPCK